MRDAAAACSGRMPAAATRPVEGSSRDVSGRSWRLGDEQRRSSSCMDEQMQREGLKRATSMPKST